MRLGQRELSENCGVQDRVGKEEEEEAERVLALGERLVSRPDPASQSNRSSYQAKQAKPARDRAGGMASPSAAGVDGRLA